MLVELVRVAGADKLVLSNLLQFYLYDYSEILGLDVNAHGVFSYHYVDVYFTEADHEAYFIMVDSKCAGFALVYSDDARQGVMWHVSEFFVLRRYRRRGVAKQAARMVFMRHPGAWSLSFDRTNKPAEALWRSVIDSVSTGPVTEMTHVPPTAPTARIELHFHITA